MTPGELKARLQAAIIAVKMLGPLEEEAKKRQGQRTDLNIAPEPAQSSPKGRAVEHAAKLVGIGKTQVQEARALRKAKQSV